ncbi:hypothetical protein Tco_0688263 [Tanacetum coccineum]
MASGGRNGRGTTLRPDERIIATKERKKAQDAQDKATDKCAGTGGPLRRPKKKKIAPIILALSNYEEGGSKPSGSETVHCISP